MLASIMSLCVYKRIQIDVEIPAGQGRFSEGSAIQRDQLDTLKNHSILSR